MSTSARVSVEIVPCLSDNYSYLIRTPDGCLVVDPSESAPVEVRADSAPIKAVLLTHHHFDHSGGAKGLTTRQGHVYIGRRDASRPAIQDISGVVAVDEESTFEIVPSCTVRAIDTPCHTRGSVCYLVHASNTTEPSFLFTGDTLFAGGCGRFFEGTSTDMFTSLQKLASLPPQTLVFPGHEYTVRNLMWAMEECRSRYSRNQELLGYIEEALRTAQAQQDQHRPTIPTTIAKELQINLFLRASSVEELQALRASKDAYKS